MEKESSLALVVAKTSGRKRQHESNHSDSNRDVLYSEEAATMELSLKNEDMALSSTLTDNVVGWVDICRRKGEKEKPLNTSGV